MPIWLRKFYLKKIQEALELQKKSHESAAEKMPGKANKRIVRK